MIREVLPSAIASAELYADPPDVVLFEAERWLVTNAVDKRRREFGTVRVCARRALHELGHPPTPLLPGQHGEPQWPIGVVGSMTHCHGYRAAAVAHASYALTIGIDAEPHDTLPTGVLESIALAEETERLAELARDDYSVCWDRLLFSCKEAVYKAIDPTVQRYVRFTEVALRFTGNGRVAVSLLLPELADNAMVVRAQYSIDDRWIVATAVASTEPGAR